MEGAPYSIKESQLLSRKLLFATSGRSSDSLHWAGPPSRNTCFQWHDGQREELTAAGTVRDLHPIPY